MTLTIDQKKILFIAYGLLAALIPVLFVPVLYIKATAAALLAIAAVLVCVLIRKRNIHSINKRQVFLLLVVIAAVYLMLYFLSGNYVGFYQNPQQITFHVIIQNILPCAVIIIATEIIRTILLAQKAPGIIVVTFLIAVLADVLIGDGVSLIAEMHRFLDIVFLHFLPAVTANILYTHISKQYGATPNIAFRLMMTLVPQLTPWIPALSEAIHSLILILFPLIVYQFIKKLYKSMFQKATSTKASALSTLSLLIPSILMISAVLLISCQFRFGLVVIASPSMSGAIEVGDAVFFEDSEHAEANLGDVVLFSKDGTTTIAHRVVDIQNINGQNRYFTKGDANEDVDYGYITDAELKGVVHFKIPLIGQPTLWLRSIFLS